MDTAQDENALPQQMAQSASSAASRSPLGQQGVNFVSPQAEHLSGLPGRAAASPPEAVSPFGQSTTHLC